ncbi:twin-arginine translocase TatA/TatE family subunit [Nocardiopsis sp. CT-R113]|uniref:Sec-independent protein translocase protein TatA n=1 Tax=Nocardiopsis codii TaxID=3065942 RepID=A0ABU7KFV5_9ACTN|nr:twin-arginine translocase TatA/TatE family subunit [Nocardiopsis sp. CT-R113]MEE2041100.1 twin-arginine translocase TatA/TatE family subunit [Nocardiopsis sp. CT-R113]
MGIGAREILVLLVIALLLFGAKRLPDLARSLGRSARILKAEIRTTADTGEQPGAGTGPARAAEDAAASRPRQSPPEQPRPQAVAHAAASAEPPLEGTVVSHRHADR